MNVCTDSLNSLSAQVVFISTIPNSSGNHRVLPALVTTLKGQFLTIPLPPPCRHHGDPPMVLDLYLYLSEIPLSQHIHALPFLLHHAGMLPADKTPAQVHIALLQGIFQAFVLPVQGSHSKRTALWIVVVIFRNEDLVQWVLHRDRPRGEILSQKESYSWVKSTRECFMQSRGFRVAAVVQGWIPAPRRTT